MRLPYAACRGEGENACVIGPADEVLAEFPHGTPEDQWDLAEKFAELLNDLNDNHVCCERAKRERASLFLAIVVSNRIGDREAMELLIDVIGEAHIKDVRRQLDDLSCEVPF